MDSVVHDDVQSVPDGVLEDSDVVSLFRSGSHLDFLRINFLK